MSLGIDKVRWKGYEHDTRQNRFSIGVTRRVTRK